MTDYPQFSSVVPSTGSQATVAAVDAPAASVTVATNSLPTSPPQVASETSVNCAGASVSALSSSADFGMAGFGIDFDSEIEVLEAQWARDGILMNSRTFATSVINESISQSSE
jgi:hypothetical protein